MAKHLFQYVERHRQIARMIENPPAPCCAFLPPTIRLVSFHDIPAPPAPDLQTKKPQSPKPKPKGKHLISISSFSTRMSLVQRSKLLLCHSDFFRPLAFVTTVSP